MAADKSVPVVEGADASIKVGEHAGSLGAAVLSDPSAGDHIAGMAPGANGAATDFLASTNFSLAADTKPTESGKLGLLPNNSSADSITPRTEPAPGAAETLSMPPDLAQTYQNIMDNIRNGQGLMPGNETSQPVESKENIPMS